jgi:hypothetical protein
MPRAHVHPNGGQIAQLRGEADLTQWQLAHMAGYGLRTIGKIEDSQPTGASTLAAVATVLSRKLNRPIAAADLMRRPNGDGCTCLRRAAEPPCVVQEAVKVLDFSTWRPTGRNGHAENRVVLADRYRFRTVGDVRTLHFHYATTGPRIDGRCLTHSHLWLPVTGQGQNGVKERHWNTAYQLRVDLEKSESSAVEVENRLEYVNGFAAEDGDWFHTHVVFPTESLTMVGLFAETKRCRAATGMVKHHPVEPFAATTEAPLVLSNGRVLFWHLTTPQQGGTYQLEWQW